MATQPETASSGTTRRRPAIGMRGKRLSARFFLIPILVLGALGAGAAYLYSGKDAAPRYLTAPVGRGIVARTVTATGTVNPVMTITVGTYVSGVIQELLCDYNTKVTKGQLCAKIDPRPYQTIVDQNRANLATAQAQLAKDQATLVYAKRSAERYARLVKLDSASQDAADNAKSAYDQALAQIALDKAAIQQRAAALNAAEVNLGYTNIVSPVDGTVVSRNVTVGQTVAASFQTPTLFLIATDLTKMQIDTNVSESDIGAIAVGDKANFTVEAFPDRSLPGRVVQVRQAPQTVQNVVTYDVVVAVDNSALLLKPGMTATVRIITDERDNVIRVPDAALRFTPSSVKATRPPAGEARIWVMRDGAPVAVPVKTGLDDDTYTEIREGAVKAGDTVLVGEQRGNSTTNARPRSFRMF